MSVENDPIGGKSEALLKYLEEHLGEEVVEPRRRVEVLIVGGGQDWPLLAQLKELAALRGLDVVARIAEPPAPRVLFVDAAIAGAISRRQALADIINQIQIEDDYPVPTFDIEELDVHTEQKPLKHHSIPKLNQFMNNQRSKGPPVRRQFAMQRPPRRGGR